MASLLQLIFSNHKRNLLRSLLVLSGMIMACAGLSAVLILNQSAQNSYEKASEPLFEGVNYTIEASQSNLTLQDYAFLRRQGFNNLVALTQRTVDASVNGQIKPLNILGIDWLALLSLPKTDTERPPAQLQFFETNAGFTISRGYFDSLGLGNVPSLFLPDLATSIKLHVLNNSSQNEQIVADLSRVLALVKDQGLTRILVFGEPNDVIIAQLKSQLPAHLILQPMIAEETTEQLTASFHLNLLAMSILMFVVCMFVVMNALNLLFSKRLQDFRVLRQLGVGARQLLIGVFVEMILLSAVCAPIGVMLGYQLASLAAPGVSLTLESLYGVKVNFDAGLPFDLIFICFFACAISSVFAAYMPFRRINQQLLVSQTEPNKTAPNSLLLSTTVCLLGLAILLICLSNHIIASFIAIAFVIIAGCISVILVLPLLLNNAAYAVGSFSALLQWSFADAVRVSHASKIAFCAFFIAISANVGMNLMVDSFRQATQQWLDIRLHAQSYVYTSDMPHVLDWLESEYPHVEAIPRLKEQGQFADQSIQLRSYPTGLRHQQAMLFEQYISSAWSEFEAGNGVLVNQQFALTYNLTLNQQVTFYNSLLQPKTVTIAGIYYDYGNPKLQMLLPSEKITLQSSSHTVIALFFDDPKLYSVLSSDLDKSFPDAQIMSTESLLRASMDTFDNTFVITQGLNLVTLLVAGFSLICSILVIDMDNRKPRAIMRSIGVSARKLFSLALLQYALLALLVCLLALPFGIGLSWMLVNLINVQAFHWSYPLIFDYWMLVRLILGSLIIVFLASLLPLYRQTNTRLIEDLKWLDN